jgi:hypothetical protein
MRMVLFRNRALLSNLLTMKIYYLGPRVDGRFDSLKAAVRRFVRRSLITAAFVSGGALLFIFGQLYASNNISVAFASTTMVQAPSPILDRSARYQALKARLQSKARHDREAVRGGDYQLTLEIMLTYFERGLYIGILIGGVLGGAIVLWMVATLAAKPTDFYTFPKTCIIGDLGQDWELYCAHKQ